MSNRLRQQEIYPLLRGKKFIVEKVYGPRPYPVGVWGTAPEYEHDAREWANRLNSGEKDVDNVHWENPGYDPGSAGYWAIVPLMQEENEWGLISP